MSTNSTNSPKLLLKFFIHMLILHLGSFEACFRGSSLANISSSLCCTYPKASPFHFLSCCIFLESHLSLQYVRGAYGWLRQGLLDWFVAPTTALYHPTVSVCSTYSSHTQTPTLSLCGLGSLYRGGLRVVNIYINIGQKQAVTLALPLG